MAYQDEGVERLGYCVGVSAKPRDLQGFWGFADVDKVDVANSHVAAKRQRLEVVGAVNNVSANMLAIRCGPSAMLAESVVSLTRIGEERRRQWDMHFAAHEVSASAKPCFPCNLEGFVDTDSQNSARGPSPR